LRLSTTLPFCSTPKERKKKKKKEEEEKKEKKMIVGAGTLGFIAPEVMDGTATNVVCDMWSAGITILHLVHFHFHFHFHFLPNSNQS